MSYSSKPYYNNFVGLVFLVILTTHFSKAGHTRGENSTASSKVCHKGYGCFTNDLPFNPKMPLPRNVEQLGTKFLLGTRENLNGTDITNKSDISCSTFNASRPTKFVIHGYMMSQSDEIPPWVSSMVEAILSNDNVNVILVNWVQGAAVEYDQAAANTRMIGAQIHKLIMYLIRKHGAKPTDFHLIGASLGAHIAGFAGKIMGQSRRKLGRISGIDPAKPAFNSNSTKVRLDRSDARFVDVIHTDTSVILHISFGTHKNLGHVDFWPNGGDNQPGCRNPKAGWMQSWGLSACDHDRGPILFTASINMSIPMIGYKCANYDTFWRGACLKCQANISNQRNNRCAMMGYWAQPPRHIRQDHQLNYYLDTSDKSPFPVRHYQVLIHWQKVAGKTTDGKHTASLFLRLHGEHMTSDPRKLYAVEQNVKKNPDIHHNETARFLLKLPWDQELGDLENVTFWWKRETCWHYFKCKDENIFVKKIRVFDATEQKQYTFITPEGLEQGIPKEISRDTKVKFVKYKQEKKNSRWNRRGSENTDQPPVRPTVEPSGRPTVESLGRPTVEPTVESSRRPTVEPTVEPSGKPTVESTVEPSGRPTADPTVEPSGIRTVEYTVEPSGRPTVESSEEPSGKPTVEHTVHQAETVHRVTSSASNSLYLSNYSFFFFLILSSIILHLR